MKKSIIIMALLMATSIGFAQHHHEKNKGEKVLTPTERMRAVLDLDEQQYASIKEINRKYAGKRSELKAAKAEDRAEHLEQRKAIHADREKEINAVLRPDQKTKWEKVKAERAEKRKAKAAEHRAKERMRVAKELELTPDQETRWKAENKAFREKKEALKKEGKGGPETEAGAELRRNHRAAVKEILTPEQYEKWKEMKAALKGKHKGNRK